MGMDSSSLCGRFGDKLVTSCKCCRCVRCWCVRVRKPQHGGARRQRVKLLFKLCFTSRDRTDHYGWGQLRTATSTFTQLLSPLNFSEQRAICQASAKNGQRRGVACFWTFCTVWKSTIFARVSLPASRSMPDAITSRKLVRGYGKRGDWREGGREAWRVRGEGGEISLESWWCSSACISVFWA